MTTDGLSAARLLGTHQPTGSWLHRLGVGWKFLIVLTPSVAVLAVRSWWLGLVAVALAVVLLLSSRISPRWTLRLPWLFVVMAVATSAYGYVALGWRSGTATLSTIVAGLLLARVLTMTTPAGDLMDGLARIARPLDRWWPSSSERFALAIALMVRSIPQLLDITGQVRQSLQARGLGRRVDLMVTPVVVQAIGQAHDTGEALLARGLGDPAGTDLLEAGPGESDARIVP